MKENIIKLQNIISEHPESDIYFEDCSDVDSIVPRVICDIEFIKDGYIFEGLSYVDRGEFKEALYDSAFYHGRAFTSSIFKDIIREYLLKYSVVDFEDLAEENRDELLNLLINKVQPKDYILVSLESIDED